MAKLAFLTDAYRFSGFRTLRRVHGVFRDRMACVVTLVRQGKKRRAEPVVDLVRVGTTEGRVESVTCRVGTEGSTWMLRFAGLTAGTAVP